KSESTSEGTQTAANNDSQDEKPESYAAGTASPAAAKILREKGIDPATIKGTGKEGRITKEDAEKAQSAPVSEKPAAKSTPVTSQPSVAVGSRNERREKMSSLRKTIAKRLVTVKNETAMLTTFNEVNMQPIMDLRSKYK